MRLDDFNRLPDEAAEAELLRCCGSIRWARLMAAARPFSSLEAIGARADTIWWSLGTEDWLEAFRAHPRIGARADSVWSAQEQSRARDASEAVRRRLHAANEAYEARFGYIFIVCASGKSAAEMLALLQQRLHNDAATEIRVAAEEQLRITELRLRRPGAASG